MSLTFHLSLTSLKALSILLTTSSVAQLSIINALRYITLDPLIEFIDTSCELLGMPCPSLDHPKPPLCFLPTNQSSILPQTPSTFIPFNFEAIYQRPSENLNTLSGSLLFTFAGHNHWHEHLFLQFWHLPFPISSPL